MTPISEVKKIISQFYGIHVTVDSLPGDEDENFRLIDKLKNPYVFKISEENSDLAPLNYQTEILTFLEKRNIALELPKPIPTTKGDFIGTFTSGKATRYFRLMSWVNGRIWAGIQPKTSILRKILGEKAGLLTSNLQNFSHPLMHREFDWNLTQSLWTKNHLGLFTEEEKELIITFQQRFSNLQNIYQNLPKSVVHNDLNDYNILVSKDLINPEVTGFIDFGDAVFTQTINDVAIVIAYAVMEVANPLEAALDILKGYTAHYRSTPEELQCLYILVAMRWITTVTKAAIRKKDKSNNPYHSISEQNAWDALKKWAT
ncbi:MAG: phosphotransferase, partial [Flavobacteriaceae bacterium]|nr:phosphotransferase [Flavobacteriaceae bacterium]